MGLDRTTIGLGVGFLVTLGAWSLHAGERALDVSVRPSVTFAPGSARIVARVEPHEDNRVLIIEADSPAFYRSSHVQLDGEHSARVHPLLLKGIPAGEYKITVRLRDSDGVRAVASGALEVIGEQR